MIRIALIVSLVSHVFWGMALYRYAEAYADLSHWACEMGNGGHECGEE